MSSKPTADKSEQVRASAGPLSRIARTVALAALVTLGLIAILGIGAGSSVACSRCHTAQSVALAASPHSSIACGTCHFSVRGETSGRFDVLARMAPSSVSGVRLEGAGREVGSRVCLSCHAKILAGGVLSKNGLRINHSRCSVASLCEDCHSQSIHGASTRLVRSPSMTDCVACHVANKALVGCSTCHDGKLPVNRVRDPEWARTHGADWKRLHGTGDLRSCVSCHATDSCRRCHGIDFPHPVNFGASHGALAKNVGTGACLTCHKSSAYCAGCHGIEMPHPAGFLRVHSKVATSDTDPKCSTCHVQDDCDQCHIYHVHPGGTQPPVGRTGGV